MADEEAKLLAELKYLTDLIGIHKDEKTTDIASVGSVREQQLFNSVHRQYNVQGSHSIRHTQGYSGKASKAQYSWTKPCKTLDETITSKEQIIPRNVVASAHILSGMPQKCSVSMGISNTRKRVAPPFSSHVDIYKGSQSKGVKKRTVVALSKACEKHTDAATGLLDQRAGQTGARETPIVAVPLHYSKSHSDELVSAIVSSLPSSPSWGKKRTVVLSPKKGVGENSAFTSSPIKKLFVEAVDCRPPHEVQVSENRFQSSCTVKPLHRDAGTKSSKRTVCLPDSLTTASCRSVDLAGGKCVGQIGSRSPAMLQHVTALKDVLAENTHEPMIQLNKYKIVRMSPTKVTAATVMPANLDVKPTHISSPLSAAVCATRTLSTPSSPTVAYQSRHRLVKVHRVPGEDVTTAPEAQRLVSTTRFTCKPAVASSSGTKLHEQGRYKLTRQVSKTRRRRQDSVLSKRHDVQSKYKLVRHHSREVAVATGDLKLINVGDGTLEPDDPLSFGAHANRFTLTQHPLKTVRQNHDMISAKRHVVLSKYKLVRPGTSVTSLRRTASKNKLVKKVASGSGWVPFRSFYNPSVLRYRKERQRHIKSPASWKKRYSIRRNSTDRQDMSINELLGRKVNNVSRNKYKFIRGGKRTTPPMNTVASRSSLKVDHRKKQANGGSRRRRSSTGKYVLIGGDVFKSSKNKLTRQTTIKRNRSGSAGMLNKGLGQHRWRGSVVSPVPSTPSSARILASRAIYRSILTSSAAKYRKNNTGTREQQQYCMFYNRFGKCNRGEKCPYIHDPEKVAVCTRFLRGTCKVTNCPFSHKVAPEKMPVCRFFLRGVCHKDNCPYLHVNVNRDAQVCPDFLRGYCPLGDKCKKKHSLVCADFERTGSCPQGSKCKMQHPQKTTRASGTGRRKRKLEAVTGTDNVVPALSDQLHRDSNRAETGERESQEDGDDINLPLKSRKLPSFIALEPSCRSPLQKTKKESLDESLGVTPLQIRPRLSFTQEDEEASPK